MAGKKIALEFDLNSEDVKIATDRTLTLKQEIRILTNELANVPKGSKEFEILSKKLNDSKDRMADLNVRSRELFGVLGALPGPLGAVGNQLDANIDLLKTFTSLTPKDLSGKLKEVGDDFKKIGKGLMDLTGLTKLYETTNNLLAASFVKVGMAEEEAAAAAKGWSAALLATGIGALVVALGLLVANWDKVSDAITGATNKSRAYEEAQAATTKAVADQIVKQKEAEELMKRRTAGLISEKDAVEEFNKKYGETYGYIKNTNEIEGLLVANGPKVIEITKLKAQAQVMYGKAAEASAKLISGEGLEPGFWEGAWGLITHFGNSLDYTMDKVTDFYTTNSKISKDLTAEGDKLMAAANNIKLEKGKGVKPGSEPKTPKEDPAVKAKKDAMELIAKYEEDGYLNTLSERDKELYMQGKKYNEALALANKYHLDTTLLKETNRQEEQKINDKYDKIDADKKKERLDKEKEFWKKLKEAADEKRKKQFDDEVKGMEDKLNLDQATLKSLEEGTQAYVLQQQKIEDDAYEIKKKKAKDNKVELEAIEKEHQANQTAITEQGEKARRALIQQRIDTIAGIGRNLQQIAGKEKGIAKAGVRIEEATTIASVWNSDTAAIAKAYKASPETFGLPWSAVYAAHLGTSIIAAHMTANNAIQAIDSGGASSGGGGAANPNAASSLGQNYGVGGMIDGPLHAQGGVMINAEGGEAVMTRGAVTMFAPLLSAMNQMGGGTSFNGMSNTGASYDRPIVPNPSSEPVIMRTYVVENELTSQQQKSARLKDLSTL